MLASDSLVKFSQTCPWWRGRPHVIILTLPFFEVSSPILGPSLLLAGCHKRNVNCSVFYTNLVLAAKVGYELYQDILSDSRPIIKESIFAPYAFNLDKEALAEQLFNDGNQFGLNSWDLYEAYKRREPLRKEQYLQCDKYVGEFLDDIVNTIVEAKPSILGFSLFGEQSMVSLAIAKRIRNVLPNMIIVMGGNNVADPMGKALLDIAPAIDYVFSGYADGEFSRFCANYLKNGTLPSCRIISCSVENVLDQIETPDYSDYFHQLKGFQKRGLLPELLPKSTPYESSRGCWWAEKRPCAFCGLNSIGVKYLKKSKKRILEELRYLKSEYDTDRFIAVDTIMPNDFDEVIHDMINLDGGTDFFYQVRVNQRFTLPETSERRGSITLQPGIESLSSNILRRMRKGTTALENIEFLREARSKDIFLAWNFLLGIPGETSEDYKKTLEILPLIHHFQPPIASGPVRIHRYSRYFNNPEEFDIKNVRPVSAYNLIYPPNSNVDDLAFYFTGDYPSLYSGDTEIYNEVIEQISRWVQLWQDITKRPKLYRTHSFNGLQMIVDTRNVANERFTILDDESIELLYVLDKPTRHSDIAEGLRASLPELLERHFVVCFEDHCISLVNDGLIDVNDWTYSYPSFHSANA